MPNSSLSKNRDGSERVHAFLKVINPNVYEMACLVFELAYYDVIVRHFGHYATETFHSSRLKDMNFLSDFMPRIMLLATNCWL